MSAQPSGAELRDDAKRSSLSDAFEEAAVVFGTIALIAFVVVALLVSVLAHQTGVNTWSKQTVSISAADALSGSGIAGGTGKLAAPSQITPAPDTEESTTGPDECKIDDPSQLPVAVALQCFVKAVASGVGTVVMVELIGGLIEYVIWTCLIIPALLLLAAWLLWQAGEWLEKHSRSCSTRRHWWQRLWCRVLRVLTWVARIIAILALIAVLVSLVYCIISIVALIAVL